MHSTQSSTRRLTPLLSPNGESIITYGFGSSVVRLWHTRSFTATSTIATIRASPRIENFVLEFFRKGNSSTGLRLDDAIVRGSTLWFLPESHSVGWVADGNKGEVRRITTRDTLDYTVPIGDIERGQWGSPHGSSHGYQVTNDGWIIGPSGRRLLMFPPPWRSDMVRRMWNGRFLALLQGALPEPVILELEP